MSPVERAKQRLAQRESRIVLPESDDARVLAAAAHLRRIAGISPILIGAPQTIRAAAAREGVSLDDVQLLDPADETTSVALAAAYSDKRPAAKPGVIKRLVSKPLFYAGLLTATGGADAMVAGAAHPSGRVIEAAKLTIGLQAGISTASSCFLINVPASSESPARALLFADCAINVEPTADILADIGLASAESMRELTGEEPRVAFLSFSTRGSAKHRLVDLVCEAVTIARRKAPALAIDGELQADAALSQRTARLKVRDLSPVAGKANVLVFPDLNSANIGYKLVQYLGGAQALGPFLQGFAQPVSDLSRGATVDDIVATAILTLARALPR